MFRFLHWRSLFRRNRFEDELANEFAFHLQARADDLMRKGISAEEAQRQARLEFGARDRYRAECRESHGLQWFDELLRNIRYALRSLRKSPAFSLAAIGSLALGIGINAFVFAVFDSLILKPLPVAGPARITFIETSNVGAVSFPDYTEFRDRNATFSGIAGYRISVMNFEHGAEPIRMWCYLATGNYFDLLGIKPAAGRFFHQADDLHQGASPYVVLSYAAWQSRFAGDPRAIGSTVRINGLPYTVLGVAPRGFHGTETFYWPEVWIPMMMQPQVEVGNAWLNERSTWDTMLIGRLKPGVTRTQAAADLNRIAAALGREYPVSDKGLQMQLAEPGFLGSSLRGAVEAFAGGVLLLAGMVLLTACSNLGSLMLARIADRQRELAIRVSIGAGRSRIVNQLLTESLVLAFLGGSAGCALAVVACRLLSAWHAPIDFPVQLAIAPDWRLLSFATAITLVVGVLFGLGPALRSLRTDANSLLKGAPGAVVISRSQRFAMRDFVLVAQIALSFVLVFGCILSVEGLRHAITMPLGFEPRNVTIASVDLGSAGFSEAQGTLFQQRVTDKLRALPGVSSAAYANSLPLSIDQSTTSVESTEKPEQAGRRRLPHANYYEISPGLLETLGVPLLRGRDFTWHDNAHAPLVAIVNQTFAKRILGATNPIGKTFRYGLQSPPVQVVGLVRDGKYVSLTEPPDAAVFRPILQQYNPTTVFVIRSRKSASALLPAIRKQIASRDPKLPIYGAGSLDEMLGFAMFPMHAAAIALSAFGVLALVLTLTGIYGLVDYLVARRTREIGIRMAVGARASELVRLMLARLILLVFAGIVIGVVLALAAGPALGAVIYATSPRDPFTFLEVLLTLFFAAVLAAWKPVARGLRIDPVNALRSE